MTERTNQQEYRDLIPRPAAQRCIAMILAGGQGSRLGFLTKKMAKPAVPFGGSYRIIDFVLSNCRNSGIATVGVLTQYQPLTLHSHIGRGEVWDLERQGGGVTILPPYTRENGADWYQGTADAIYQNIGFIEQFEPTEVLILSGDHIYMMDYSDMLTSHRLQAADVSIGVVTVAPSEASRFGIVETVDGDWIGGFQEKPQQPRSNLASMGIYVFKWSVLREYLERDARAATSAHDFGQTIIPAMLADGRRLLAHRFHGYWKDVGTIQSYWEANMDAVAACSSLNLYDPSWPIDSRHSTQAPHYIADTARVESSLIGADCRIEGHVSHSVIFPGCHIGAGAEVSYAIVMPATTIAPAAKVRHAIIGTKAWLGEGAVVCGSRQDIVTIPERVRIMPPSGRPEGKSAAKQVG